MKKVAIITIGIFIAVVIIYFLPKTNNKRLIAPPCAREGEISSAPWPDFETKECCDGLGVVSGSVSYNPNVEWAGDDGCVNTPGGADICSDCGNNTCEGWENRCNCPEDCK